MIQKFIHIDSDWILSHPNLFLKRRVVIITGAGISVASGIPDFRSKNGIFSEIRKSLNIKGEDLFNFRYSRDNDTRPSYYKFISELKDLIDKVQPSFTHSFLNTFKKYQKKYRVYTQNIDSLEERAGLICNNNNKTQLVYLHGDMKHLICTYCGHKIEYTKIENEIYKKGKNVICTTCVELNQNRKINKTRLKSEGYMHTNIIHYNQPHYDGIRIAELFESDMDLDLFIVMGTSLKVYGVKEFVKRALKCVNKNSGKSILVNLEEPCNDFKKMFDYFWMGKADDFCKVVNNTVNANIEMRSLKENSVGCMDSILSYISDKYEPPIMTSKKNCATMGTSKKETSSKMKESSVSKMNNNANKETKPASIVTKGKSVPNCIAKNQTKISETKKETNISANSNPINMKIVSGNYIKTQKNKSLNKTEKEHKNVPNMMVVKTNPKDVSKNQKKESEIEKKVVSTQKLNTENKFLLSKKEKCEPGINAKKSILNNKVQVDKILTYKESPRTVIKKEIAIKGINFDNFNKHFSLAKMKLCENTVNSTESCIKVNGENNNSKSIKSKILDNKLQSDKQITIKNGKKSVDRNIIKFIDNHNTKSSDMIISKDIKIGETTTCIKEQKMLFTKNSNLKWHSKKITLKEEYKVSIKTEFKIEQNLDQQGSKIGKKGKNYKLIEIQSEKIKNDKKI